MSDITVFCGGCNKDKRDFSSARSARGTLLLNHGRLRQQICVTRGILLQLAMDPMFGQYCLNN